MVLSEEAWSPAAGGHGDDEQGPEEGQSPGGSTPASLPPRPACHPGQGDRSDSFTVPRGSPLSTPRSPRAQSSPGDPATRAFPSPPPPGSGRGRWKRAPAGLFSGRTGTRDNAPQRVFEGDTEILSPETNGKMRAGLWRGREVARVPYVTPGARPPTTNKTPDQTKTRVKGMTGKRWRRGSLARFCDKIASALGATEAELGQGRLSERARAFLKMRVIEKLHFAPRKDSWVGGSLHSEVALQEPCAEAPLDLLKGGFSPSSCYRWVWGRWMPREYCIGATILKASPPTIFFCRNLQYVLPIKCVLPAFLGQRTLILMQNV